MFYRSLHHTKYVLQLVSLYDLFFTVSCFNYMYNQSVPYRVVEASFFSFLIVSSRTSYVFLIVNRYIYSVDIILYFYTLLIDLFSTLT